MREDVATTKVEVNGHACRVWTKGQGPLLGFLPGIGGLPRWIPFLDTLARERRVIAPSLPGFPGAEGHDQLDTHFDWLLATYDLLEKCGLAGADLIASSVSGALAADVAAVWPGFVNRLILIAPFGLFNPDEPATDIWAQRPGHLSGLLCNDAQTYKDFVAQPDDADPLEWKVEQMRALEASARFLFPTGNTGLAARLHRIRNETLLIWGERDRVMPISYAERLRSGIAGPAAVISVPGAGHLAELDAPDLVAQAVLDFTSQKEWTTEARRTRGISKKDRRGQVRQDARDNLQAYPQNKTPPKRGLFATRGSSNE